MTTPLPTTLKKRFIFINKECTQTNIPLLLAGVFVAWQDHIPGSGRAGGWTELSWVTAPPDTGHRHSCSLCQLELGGAALGGAPGGHSCVGLGALLVSEPGSPPAAASPKESSDRA